MGGFQMLKVYCAVIVIAGVLHPVKGLNCLCGGFVNEGGPRQNFDSQVECLPMQNVTDLNNSWARMCLDEYGRPKPSDNKVCSLGICHSGVYCLQSIVRQSDYTYSMYTCVNEELAKPFGRPLSCQSSKYSKHQHAVDCCKDSHLCNGNLNVSLPKFSNLTTTSPQPSGDANHDIVLVAILPIACLLIVSVGGTILVMKLKSCRQNGSFIPLFKAPPHEPTTLEEPVELLGETIGKELVPLMEASSYHSSSIIKPLLEDNGSGSGAGLPVLTQQRISQQITILKEIGAGSFGKVLLGTWRSGPVAVKTFPTTRHNSWHRECEIFQTDMLRHENILGFIAADSKDGEYWTEFILVTDYHENGSLFDYLSAHVLGVDKVLAMIISITSGLLHLHMPIVGTKGKPAIAHRDFKTRNILVKRDLTCAIGDLGLCVKHVPESNKIDLPPNTEIGTRRYLAPEILDGTINASSFDDWAMVDIYAFGLVVWEILRRCVVKGEVDTYQLPYYDVVPSDPTTEDMREAVVVKRLRPEWSPRWDSIEALVATSTIMTECWSHEPQARLPVLRIKKTLAKALEKHKETYGPKANDPAA